MVDKDKEQGNLDTMAVYVIGSIDLSADRQSHMNLQAKITYRRDNPNQNHYSSKQSNYLVFPCKSMAQSVAP